MKLFICGHARHGKDTVAEIIRDDFGLSFDSSSHFAMNRFLRDELKNRYGLTYETAEECYRDRVNHRAKWFQIIADYNLDEPRRLSEEIFKAHDIYVGIRNRVELYDARDLADFAVWVDASKRVPIPEGVGSNNITPDDCDFSIPNNGDIRALYQKVRKIFRRIVPIDRQLARQTP